MNLLATFETVIITLKLCGVISWPWIWILFPILLPIALFGSFLLLFIILGGIGIRHIEDGKNEIIIKFKDKEIKL